MTGAAFYRFDPLLSEDIALDNNEDGTLLNMLWETECYINDNREMMADIAKQLV